MFLYIGIYKMILLKIYLDKCKYDRVDILCSTIGDIWAFIYKEYVVG